MIKTEASSLLSLPQMLLPQRLPSKRDIDETSRAIAGGLMEFFRKEVASGRLGKQLQPMGSGLGGIAAAVLRKLGQSEFENIEIFSFFITDLTKQDQ